MSSGLLQQSGLSLDRLQNFCRVAESGGVTKAAKGDPAKQSLFSRQIKELEQFFGVELIRRKGRGIALTPAGERLHMIAREQFSSLSDFKSECGDIPVELSIGAGDSFIQWLLLPRLEAIRSRLPNVRLKFLNLPTTEIIKRLSEGLLDFGVIRKDAASRQLETTSLGVLSYSLFLPPGFRAPGKTKNKPEEILNDLPFATLEGEGNFRQELSAITKKHKLQFNTQIECSSFPLVARALQTGAFAAILPNIASVELKSLSVAELKPETLKGFDREICLVWNPRLARVRSAINKATKVFAAACKILE